MVAVVSAQLLTLDLELVKINPVNLIVSFYPVGMGFVIAP
jgi:hypothetical protein